MLGLLDTNSYEEYIFYDCQIAGGKDLTVNIIKYKIASCDKFTLNYFIFSFGPTLNNYSSFGPTLTLTFLLPEKCFNLFLVLRLRGREDSDPISMIRDVSCRLHVEVAS